VFALAAGARRTADAPDAYTAAAGGDVDGTIEQQSGAPRTDEVGALSGVASAQSMTFIFAGVVDSQHEAAIDTLSFAGIQPPSSRLVVGRTTDPANPHEFVADKTFAAAHDAHVGDRFKVISWNQEQADHGQGFGDDPQGPSFEAVLVGIVDASDKLEVDYSIAVFSPALLDLDVGKVATIMSIRLEPGVTLTDLRTELDRLPGGQGLSLEPGRVISADVRNAVDAQALATWLMAAVGAAAAIIALGQLLSRHARLSSSERDPLSALGFTRGQLLGETIGRAAVPAIVGLAGGWVIATLASSRFPAGFVRPLEPDPGLRVDLVAFLIGTGVLLTYMLLWVGIASLATARNRTRPRTPWWNEALARRAPNPAAATGARFALTAHDGSTAAAAGTVIVLGVIIALLVGTLAFAASLDRLVTDRGRFGSNYTFAVGDNSDLDADQLRSALEGDRDISGMMILSASEARRGRTTVELVGVEHVQGALRPRILSGREPTAPDEIALGRVTARQLDLGVGGELELAGDSAPHAYRVVGIAVVPTIGGNDGVGRGAIVTADALPRLRVEPTTVMAAIELRDGVSLETARQRIRELVGATPGPQDVPSSILNVSRVRRIPVLLAAMLGALGLVTLVHALIVSIQNRRRDLAVLRALGADRVWLARLVHWQASVLTVLPLIPGIPLGLVAGAVVFRAFTDRIGALPDPAFPFVAMAAIALALIVVANVAAVVPARRARRMLPAELLRDE
jgi:hypothetical protein